MNPQEDEFEPEPNQTDILAVLYIFLVVALILLVYYHSPLSKKGENIISGWAVPSPNPCRVLGKELILLFDNNEYEFYNFALPEAITEYYRTGSYSQVLKNPKFIIKNLFSLVIGGVLNDDPESILRQFDIESPEAVTAVMERARQVMKEGHPELHLVAELGLYGEVVYCRTELRHTTAPRVALNVTYYGDPTTREVRVEDVALAW